MSRSDKPLIVPIFIPQAGCRHQCVFCNQALITGVSGLPELSDIRSRIASFLKECRPAERSLEIAFYGGNFLGLPADKISAYLSEATAFINEHGDGSIRFSTRPDTIYPDRIALLEAFPVRTIEIGAQSMDDAILFEAGRGHRAEDTKRAAVLVKSCGFRLGLQMMTGLPGDDEAISMETAHQLAALAPEFVRIYPTVVVAGSRLASWYQEGAYIPWPLDRAVFLVKELVLFFQSRQIPVIRMGLQATDDLKPGDTLLAGPFHPAFGHLVLSEIALEETIAVLDKWTRATGKDLPPDIILRVHPRWESRFRGMRNENIHRLQKKYGFRKIMVQTDCLALEGSVAVINPEGGSREPEIRAPQRSDRFHSDS